jgi:hypothetical protein
VHRAETKRHLPHLQTPQSTYFVTFRCRPGIFLGDEAKRIVLSAIRHWDGLRIELDAAVIMPAWDEKGPLWLDESFDHIIRHEQEWDEKVGYVRDNPAKRGLVKSWQEYPWLWLKRGQPNQKDDRLENLSHAASPRYQNPQSSPINLGALAEPPQRRPSTTDS